MRTLTTKEYELISKIYNSTDEIESNLSFEFGIQSDFYYQLFHSYSETKKGGQKVMNYTREELFKHSGELLELIEDVVSYYCDENRISGELAYSIVEGIGVAKQLQLIPEYDL